MEINIDYIPTAKQCMFHSSTADEVLYGGAAGGGKSRAIVMEAFIDALEHPGIHSYLFRKTYPELRDTLIKEAQANIPKEIGTYKSTEHDYVLKNGSVLHFRYCRNIQDAYIYQGTEMHRLYIDELTHFTKEVYDQLRTRVRAAKGLNVKPRIRCTSNPGNVGHGWVKARFIDGKEPYKNQIIKVKSETLGKEVDVTVQYIPAKATDNPHLTEDYIIELEQKPEALRKAYLDGNWDIFEGQVFTEWRNNSDGYYNQQYTHVIKPFDIPSNWRIYRSLDHGYSKPYSVGWYAVSHDGTIYRIAEDYGCVKGQPNTGLQLSVPEIAQRIKDKEKNNPYLKDRHILGIADPAIWQKTTGKSIADDFAAAKIYFSKGDHTRLPGKMQFHYRLRFDDKGYAKFYVFDCCTEFIRTFPTLVYSIRNVEDIDTDCEDHIYDECRYLLMEHPISPPPKPTYNGLPEDDPLNQRVKPKKDFYAL